MPSARLLNQVNKVRETERYICSPCFVISLYLLLKATCHLHNARVWPIGFGATFVAVFILIYWLREFPLSEVTNRFELTRLLKATVAIVLQNLSSLFQSASFNENIWITAFYVVNVC